MSESSNPNLLGLFRERTSEDMYRSREVRKTDLVFDEIDDGSELITVRPEP